MSTMPTNSTTTAAAPTTSSGASHVATAVANPPSAATANATVSSSGARAAGSDDEFIHADGSRRRINKGRWKKDEDETLKKVRERSCSLRLVVDLCCVCGL